MMRRGVNIILSFLTAAVVATSCVPIPYTPVPVTSGEQYNIIQSPSPITPTLTPTSSPTPITPTLTPSPSPITPTLTPISPQILLDVPVFSQEDRLTCELAAAGMVAAYFNPTVPKGHRSWENYFVSMIPKDSCDPNKSFRGAIDGIQSITNCDSTYGYGVYNGPLAKVMREAGFDAEALSISYDGLRNELARGNPVIVWLSYRDDPIKECEPPLDCVLVPGEHAVVVVGYRLDKYVINDPWGGRRYSIEQIPRWEDFGNMALVVRGLLRGSR